MKPLRAEIWDAQDTIGKFIRSVDCDIYPVSLSDAIRYRIMEELL